VTTHRVPEPCEHYHLASIASLNTYECADCGMGLCSSCYDAPTGCCEACADNFYLSSDALLALINEWPGLVMGDLAERARTAALTARFNRGDRARHVPEARWYLGRVKDLLPDLQRMGLATCGHTHSHRRRDDFVLCEWRAVPVRREAVTA